MMSELPEDLLEEIFFRLPATSLSRLRSTCKRWNRLLKDMRFTTKHFEKAPKQFQSIMLKESAGVCLMHINIDRFTVKREATLTDPHSTVDQIKIGQVSHCDGLLLCCIAYSRRLVVWNPCTGQTKWIRPKDDYGTSFSYALGSYHDKRSNGNSYKILRHRRHFHNEIKHEFGIYEINSYSWRILDVTIDFKLEFLDWGVSLKGKTYWIGNRYNIDTCIVSFDYTTEGFERLCPLPCQYDFNRTLSLSVVGEEKLAVLLQHLNGEKAEIWVTNKISETKEVSWSKVLAVDLHAPVISREGVSFVVDEKKKVVVFISGNRVHIVGEDNNVRRVDLEFKSSTPFLFNYVPSLIQLQQGIGGKRKWGE